MMRGFWIFFIGCLVVAALSTIDPNSARWYALSLLGVLYVVSALPRRRAFGSATDSASPTPRRRAARS